MGLTKNKNMSKSKTKSNIKSNIKTKTKKRCNKSSKNGIVSRKNMRGGQKPTVKPVNTGKKLGWVHTALRKVGYNTATMKIHQAQQAQQAQQEQKKQTPQSQVSPNLKSTYNQGNEMKKVDPVKVAENEALQQTRLEKKLQILIEGKTQLEINEELSKLRQPSNTFQHTKQNAAQIANRRVRSGMVPITQGITPEEIKKGITNNDNLLGPLQSNIPRLREEANVEEMTQQIKKLEELRKPLNISTLTDQGKKDLYAGNLELKNQREQNDIKQAQADAMFYTLEQKKMKFAEYNKLSNKQKTELEKSNSYKKYMNDFKQKKAEEKAQSIIKFLKEKGTKNSQPRSKRITPDIIAEIIRIKSENTGNLSPEQIENQIENQKEEIQNLFVKTENGRLKGIFDKNMIEEISKYFSESSINNVETILKSSKQEETSNQSSII